MIFLGTIKGVMCALAILLCLFLLLKIFVANFRLSDEVSFLLMVSIGASAILMSIFFCVKGSETKILNAQNRIHQGLNQESILSYIDEYLPEVLSSKQSAQHSKSELQAKVDQHAASTIRGLRITRTIVLIIEIIIQILIFVIIRSKMKSSGGYGRRTSYMDSGYYE